MRILRFLKLSKGDGAPAPDTGFDPTTTRHFQVKMRRRPMDAGFLAWFLDTRRKQRG